MPECVWITDWRCVPPACMQLPTPPLPCMCVGLLLSGFQHLTPAHTTHHGGTTGNNTQVVGGDRCAATFSKSSNNWVCTVAGAKAHDTPAPPMTPREPPPRADVAALPLTRHPIVEGIPGRPPTASARRTPTSVLISQCPLPIVTPAWVPSPLVGRVWAARHHPSAGEGQLRRGSCAHGRCGRGSGRRRRFAWQPGTAPRPSHP